MAHNKTAPAAQSFARLAKGWRPGDAKSTAASTAVFMHSAPNTAAHDKTTAAHSPGPNPNHAPKPMAATAAAQWIFMFRWVRVACQIPDSAHRNEAAILWHPFPGFFPAALLDRPAAINRPNTPP